MKDTEKKINITLKTEDGKPAVILFGEHKHPEVREILESVNFKGLISAPADFLLEKVSAGLIDKKKVLVIIDEQAEKITLHSDYDNKLKHVVEGSLIKNKDISEMKINSTDTFTLKDMIKLLRFRRKLFNTEDEYKSILNTLMTFNAKISTELKMENDQRGNITEELVMKAKTNLKLHFTLNAAAFKGGPVAKFRVDIYFDVISSSDFKFYFESVDYHDLQLGQAHDLIGEQVERLKDYTIVYK